MTQGLPEPLCPLDRLARRGENIERTQRWLPEETPIALSFNGTAYAVMMGTPADLEDFAVGFALCEGIAASPGDVPGVETVAVEGGIDCRIELVEDAARTLEKRRRRIAGPVGCGLCGIDSIAEAVRSVPSVEEPGRRFDQADVVEAMGQLAPRQTFHRQTGAVHAAGFYRPGQGIVAVREDVGRHNALDKLIGALARGGETARDGLIVITSRVSVEMVQKAAIAGAPVLAAVSAPTALAVRTAETAGMTLVALVRGDDFDIFTRPDRLVLESAADGARKGQSHVA